MVVLYSDIKKEIQTGDLLAWETTSINGFFDFLLFLYQKIFKARFTHVGVAVRINGRVFMVDATPPMVRLFPVSMTRDFYLIKTNIKATEKHIDILLSRLGNRYSLLDMIRGILNFKKDDTKDYCSDLVGDFYNQIGYINDENAGRTPDTIVEAIIKASGSEPIFVKIDRGNLNVL